MFLQSAQDGGIHLQAVSPSTQPLATKAPTAAARGIPASFERLAAVASTRLRGSVPTRVPEEEGRASGAADWSALLGQVLKNEFWRTDDPLVARTPVIVISTFKKIKALCRPYQYDCHCGNACRHTRDNT